MAAMPRRGARRTWVERRENRHHPASVICPLAMVAVMEIMVVPAMQEERRQLGFYFLIQYMVSFFIFKSSTA